MVESNQLLYKRKEEMGVGAKKGEHPDHLVVIKHVPSVGDDKRALDEYYSELSMGGRVRSLLRNHISGLFPRANVCLPFCSSEHYEYL